MTELPVDHVLYAEDDPNDIFFMTHAFAQLGHRELLQVVTNGQQAVEVLAAALADEARAMPDVVLLDVKMPQLTGREVLLWIRERPEFDRVPVVLFTSSTQPSEVRFAHAQGANGFFVKPSDARSLASIMDGIMRSVPPWHAPAARTHLSFPENLLRLA